MRVYQELCLKEGRKDRDGRREGKKEGRKEGRKDRMIRRKKEDATNSTVGDLL